MSCLLRLLDVGVIFWLLSAFSAVSVLVESVASEVVKVIKSEKKWRKQLVHLSSWTYRVQHLI